MRFTYFLRILVAVACLGSFTTQFTNYSFLSVFPNAYAISGPDFSIKCLPNGFLLHETVKGTTTCTVTSLGGYNSGVSLSCSGQPITASCSFSEDTVTPPAGGIATSVLTLDPGAIPIKGPNRFFSPLEQLYKFQIVATDGTITHSFDFFFGITEVRFSISCGNIDAPERLSGSNNCTITNNLNSDISVTLGCSGEPATSSCSFDTNPVPVAHNNQASSKLTVNTGTAASGHYTFDVTGVSGPISHSATAHLNIISQFDVHCTPNSLVMAQTDSKTSSCTVHSNVDNQAITVEMSCSDLLVTQSCEFSHNPLTIPSNGNGLTTLTLNANSADLLENTIQVVGTNGDITHSTKMSVSIIPNSEFAITCSPDSLSMAQDTSGVSDCTIMFASGFASPVTLSCSGQPVTGNCFFSPQEVNPPVGGAGGPMHTTIIFSDDATAIGHNDFSVIGTAAGPITHSTNFALDVGNSPDFSMSCSPNSITTFQTTNCSVMSLNGFSGNVALSCKGLPETDPPNPQCHIEGIRGEPSVDVPTGGSTNFKLTITMTHHPAEPSAELYIIGTNHDLIRSTTIIPSIVSLFVVPEYSIGSIAAIGSSLLGFFAFRKMSNRKDESRTRKGTDLGI